MEVRQLPRGRHRLSREEVSASQRQRMLEAMALAVHEKGYTGTAVADVVAGAGVSRETFYQHFADKEACFLAAYEVAVGTMRQTMGDPLAGRPTDPLACLDRALRAYLDLLASEGAMARVFLVDVYAAGPQALQRRREVQEDFTAVIAGSSRPARPPTASPARRWWRRSAPWSPCALPGEFDALPGLRTPLVALARRLRLTPAARSRRATA